MKKILAALAVLGVVISCVVARPWTPASDMQEICGELQANCSKLPEPVVVITQIVPKGYLGLYSGGEPYIFIQASLPWSLIQQVKYHETVHYIIDHLYLDYDSCQSEAQARRLTAKKFNLTRNDEWRKQYGC